MSYLHFLKELSVFDFREEPKKNGSRNISVFKYYEYSKAILTLRLQ